MSLKSTEWTNAQGLLIQLVKFLEPVAGEDFFSMDKSCQVHLNKRLYIPSFRSSDPAIPFSARLLQGLESTRQRLQILVENTPLKTDEEAPIRGEGEEQNLKEKPVSQSAKRIIEQVRNAIAVLATSSNLADPRPDLLHTALRKLKPMIDELIEAVGQGELPSKGKEPPSSAFRHSVPKSPREAVLKKIEKFLPMQKGEPATKRTERTQVPIIPYAAHPLSRYIRKKKNKKKELWSTKDEEDSPS